MTMVAELPAGFADKVLSAQMTFRSVMNAMARPGSVRRIVAVAGSPAPMMRATAAIALTLFDHDTPLWLDARMAGTIDIAKWLRFHTGAPIVAESSICSFALVGDAIVCYRCGAHHKGLEASPSHQPFELTVGERYRQERIRREQLKTGS